ncbi:MAG: PAS domain S-box protein [Anaeromyxobacter sp.]|nr:PAS domain S-box protein [Anaeromyxobacter sp.]MBL0275635.1 PAS domain S-box protein [Anaeromyxobacter sp.]
MAALSGDALLTLLTSSAREVLVVLGPADEVRWISPSVERLLGWRPEALAGRPLAGLAQEADRAAVAAHLAAARGGQADTLQFRLACAEGGHRWVECAATPAQGEAAAGGAVCVLRDDEAHRAARASADDALREKETYLRAVFDNALDPMVILDGAAVIVDANPAAVRLVGSGPAPGRGGRALLGTVLKSLVTPGRVGELTGTWRRFLAERQVTGRTELASAAGPRTVEFALVADVLPGLHLGVVRDVTDLLTMQARLAGADRLASVGTVAAGVAHELKNPLAYVGANLEYLEAGLAGLAARHPEEARALAPMGDALREALVGAQRMQVIVRDLKTFSRDDDAPDAVADVHRVLESCVNMSAGELKKRALLRKSLAPVPLVRLSEARLGQVLLNLLVNAAQAIPEGDPRGHEVALSTRVLPDGRVEVEVRDSGPGIPATVLPRIFEPFYTTKRAGEGTGLGLSICRSILEGAGGSIEVESTPGQGARFRVALPAVGREAPAP